MSFHEVMGVVNADMVWRGIQNYTELFRTKMFLSSLRNVTYLWILGGIAMFLIVYVMVFLMNTGIKGKKTFRALLYLPNLIPVVAAATMWTQYIYSPRNGMLEKLFTFLRLHNLVEIKWLGGDMIFWSMTIAIVWGAIGYFLIIILAGYERIPDSFFEAAKIDGASYPKMFFSITLPLTKDTLQIGVVLWSVASINQFAFPRLFTSVGMVEGTYTPSVYMYELAFGAGNIGVTSPQIGKAAAIGVILMGLVIVISWLINTAFKTSERLEF